MTNERPSESATGGQKNLKDERFDLIPIGPLTQLARHYGVGARKYDDNQWRKGYEFSKSYAALQRHASQWWGGEDIDEETGSSHLAAVAWHAFTLLEFMENNPEFDDRFKREVEPDPWKVGDRVSMFYIPSESIDIAANSWFDRLDGAWIVTKDGETSREQP